MQGFGMDAEALVPCKQVASAGGKKQGIQFEQLVCTHKMLCTAIFSNAEHCNGRAGSLFCRGSSMSRVPLANSRSASQAHCGGILFKTPPSPLLQKCLEMGPPKGGSTEASDGLRKPKNVMSAACSSVPLHWVPP